jgi:hypothetical protein
LQDWHLVGPLVRSWLDQGAVLLSRLPEGVAIAAILLPVVLSFFSRRMIVLVSCIVGAVIVFFSFVAPSYAAAILAAGAYLGTVIIALAGVVSRRKAAARHHDLAQLRRDVDNLLAAENRRLLNGLRVPAEERSADTSTTPASRGPHSNPRNPDS